MKCFVVLFFNSQPKTLFHVICNDEPTIFWLWIIGLIFAVDQLSESNFKIFLNRDLGTHDDEDIDIYVLIGN